MEPNKTTPIPPPHTPVIPTLVPKELTLPLKVVIPAPVEVKKKIPDISPKPLVSSEHTFSWGTFIGIIIILAVLIIGALYFWGAKLAEKEAAGSVPEFAETASR